MSSDSRHSAPGTHSVPVSDTSTGSRLVRAAIRCYPRPWRERHGEEAAELGRMLVADGSPPPVVALSYLVAAGRERARLEAERARLEARRGRAAAGAAAAALSLLGAGTALLAPTAQASPVHAVQVRVTRPADAVGQLSAALARHELHVSVVGRPVAHGLVGSVLSVQWRLAGPVPIGILYGPCPTSRASACAVGARVPVNLAAPAEIVVGVPRSGEGAGMSAGPGR